MAANALETASEHASPEKPDEPSDAIEFLREQLNDANNRVLRAQAELENFRKRVRRDMDEQRQYANLPLVSDLLPAFDNLDRAVEAANDVNHAGRVLGAIPSLVLDDDRTKIA